MPWNWFNLSGYINEALMKPHSLFPKGWSVLLIQGRSLQTWAKRLTFCVSLSTAGTAVNNLLWKSRTALWGWRSPLLCPALSQLSKHSWAAAARHFNLHKSLETINAMTLQSWVTIAELKGNGSLYGLVCLLHWSASRRQCSTVWVKTT